MTITVSLELSMFIIAVALVILVALAIPTFFQIRRACRALEEFSVDGKKFLEDIKEITNKVNGQLGDIDDATKKIRDVALKAAGVVEGVIDAVKGPADKIAGVLTGVSYVLKHFKKGGNENERE